MKIMNHEKVKFVKTKIGNKFKIACDKGTLQASLLKLLVKCIKTSCF